MKLGTKILSLTAILFALFSSLALPSPAYAIITVQTVSPPLVVNDIPTTITITGIDFAAGCRVFLGITEITVTYVDVTTVKAIVPQNMAVGVYDVQVVNPDTTSSTRTSGLTVAAPTTTPPIPPSTATPAPFGRPQLAMKSFRTNVGEIRYGQSFNLVVRMENAGQYKAYNVQASFTSSDLVPTKTGGLAIVGDVNADSSFDVGQQMTAAAPLYGKTNVLVEMTVTYYDEKGTQYSEKFTMNVPVVASNYVYYSPTPTAATRSQLVITAYETNLQPLQPGAQFALKLTIQNMGNANAKGVTMIVGGGSTGSSGGTPQPGGVSGGSGEFSNFAPVGSSNVQSLGDIASGGTFTAEQNLIVNVSTNPGAYPLKITLSYTDAKNNIVNDEQVITLLVYQLPVVELSFYQPVVSLTAGMPNPLPIQLTNLGKKSAVLGNMKVTTNNGVIENDTTLVGNIEAGGFFTFDSTVFPDSPGPLELTVTIDYTDDFNQSRTIVKSMKVEVMEMPMEPTPDPNMPGGGDFPMPGGEETFWQKAWRFLLGLFGLDSGAPQPIQPPMEEPMPLPGGGGGFKG